MLSLLDGDRYAVRRLKQSKDLQCHLFFTCLFMFMICVWPASFMATYLVAMKVAAQNNG